jgi:hypothetical protein
MRQCKSKTYPQREGRFDEREQQHNRFADMIHQT